MGKPCIAGVQDMKIDDKARQFSIGDRVRVRLDRLDPVERKLQFALVEPGRKKS